MPVLTDTGIELITSKFIEADTDSTGSVNAEQLLIIFRPFFDSIGLDPPNEERIANRLASMQTETPGELTLTELLILMAYLKIMRICESKFYHLPRLRLLHRCVCDDRDFFISTHSPTHFIHSLINTHHIFSLFSDICGSRHT